MTTGISWTDETWTVVTGCSKVSAGCAHCYAEQLAPRLAAMGKEGYTSLPWKARNAEKNVVLRPERLDQPLRWKRPRRVFVTSMGDLFHELVPFEFVDRVLAVMALASQHTFQVLTKRPERMAAYFAGDRRYKFAAAVAYTDPPEHTYAYKRRPQLATECRDHLPWPLSNVWLGTSVEDQKAANERIPHLLRTPAAVRFLSCEPLLGPVDLWSPIYRSPHHGGLQSAFGWGEGVHWVIAGGESGLGHRDMDPDWMRKIRDDCSAAGVAFFGKQASGPRNEMPLPKDLQVREFPNIEQEATV